jgi:hypothetical protein
MRKILCLGLAVVKWPWPLVKGNGFILKWVILIVLVHGTKLPTHQADKWEYGI